MRVDWDCGCGETAAGSGAEKFAKEAEEVGGGGVAGEEGGGERGEV